MEGCGRERRETARIAAKFWDEYSKRQTLLSTFFAQGPTKAKSNPSPDTSATATLAPQVQTCSDDVPAPSKSMDYQHIQLTSAGEDEIDATQSTTHDEINLPSNFLTPPSTGPNDDLLKAPLKRKTSGSDGSAAEVFRKVDSEQETKTSKTVKKVKLGQATLASFFSQSTSSKLDPATKRRKKSSLFPAEVKRKPNNSQSTHSISDDSDPETEDRTTQLELSITDTINVAKQLEEDYAYALSLTEAKNPPSTSQKSSLSSSASSRDAWSKLTGPMVPPRCAVHREPTKQFTVNKPGPNKGKLFYICSRSVLTFNRTYLCLIIFVPQYPRLADFARVSIRCFRDYRPVGPGYDAGRSVRLREEVDPRYRCDFFKWAADVRREQAAAAVMRTNSTSSSHT